MKVACSPDWNLLSRPDARELADVVVVVELVPVVEVVAGDVVAVVVEDAAELEVVVLLLPEFELQPATSTATVASRATPATPRLSLRPLASLFICIP
jgi:hypothetical protein